MKSSLRNAVWACALTIAVTALGSPTLATAHQSQRGMERGRGHDDANDKLNNPQYQQGLREYRLRSRDDANRRAYESGYDQGYRNSRGGTFNQNRARDENSGYNVRHGQTGRFGQYSPNGDLAAQMGSQDGLNDGRQDRLTGHSNRPTQGDNYKNATRGFTGGEGQTAYKAAYRQAYLPAYQRGYNEQINNRR